jgi:type I restriction enzyme, S subunit
MMSNRNAHKLGYKHTPLGWIPEGWRIHELREHITSFSGGTPSRDVANYYAGNIPWIKSGDLNKREIYGVDEFISEEGLKNSSAKMVEPDTLLIALYGATAGVTAFSKIYAAINQAVLAINLPNGTYDKKFLDNWFQFNREKIIYTYCQGGQPNLSAELIKSLLVKTPLLLEQQCISKVLSTWDEAITKIHQLIAQQQQRNKGLMQQLLTGTTRLKTFTGKWKQFSISELFELIDRYIKWNDSALYRLVSIRRRHGGVFFRGDLTGKEISVKCLKEVQTNDFLISKRQVAHGAWAVVSETFNGGKVSDEYDCLTIKDPNKLTSGFWKWYCQQPIMKHYAFLDSNGVHIEKLIFDFDQFKKRKVLLPTSLQEQTAIAEVLEDGEAEIELLKRKLDKLKEQKKGLMQKLLTGEVRVEV